MRARCHYRQPVERGNDRQQWRLDFAERQRWPFGSESVRGHSAAGAFTQSGGTNNAGSSLVLGASAGGNGTYTLGGSGLLTTPVATIGQAGIGTFTQSGGTNSIGTALYLGYFAGSSGTYNLNGERPVVGLVRVCGLFGHGGLHTDGRDPQRRQLPLSRLQCRQQRRVQFERRRSVIGRRLSDRGIFRYRQHSRSPEGPTSPMLSISATSPAAAARTDWAAAASCRRRPRAWAIRHGDLHADRRNQWHRQFPCALYRQQCRRGTRHSGSRHSNLSGGQVSAASETVGSGTFTQSGGANNMSSSLLLDCTTGNNAAYSLSGNGQLSANIEYVGEFGTGDLLARRWHQHNQQ